MAADLSAPAALTAFLEGDRDDKRLGAAMAVHSFLPRG
jgi:hypothetical protein